MLIYCDHPTVRDTVMANKSSVNNQNLLLALKISWDEVTKENSSPHLHALSFIGSTGRISTSRFLVLTLQI